MLFRNLRADEIECRLNLVKENGVSLLLYKDARCDMNILDETVGEYNWKREHLRENANCIVSLWDNEKKEWISKEDTGVESYSQKEKGLASDSFKRACVNWGIGRELYTAPFIWVTDCNIRQAGNKYTCNDKFQVSKMKVEQGNIVELEIINLNKKGQAVYTYKKAKADKAENVTKEMVKSLSDKIKIKGLEESNITEHYKVNSLSDMTIIQYKNAMKLLDKYEDKTA